MKVVVIEGPDGAGKTTLAREAQHLEYIHFGPPPKWKNGAWLQYFDLLKDLWENPRPDGVVIDRFIYGELIYGPILRGGTDLTWAHVRMLERVLMGLSAQLVVCIPPWQIVWDNWQKNLADELIQDEDQMFQVYTFYQDLLKDKNRMIPRSLFDYTDHSASMSTPDTERKVWFRNEGPGIGLFAPGNILMVGEEVNTRTGLDGWPFVALGGSSLWLAQLMEEANIPEHGLYWVNATTNGSPTHARFTDILAPERIIAMGARAQIWCKTNGLLCEPVEHPQYHKRFRHNEPYPLIELLTP